MQLYSGPVGMQTLSNAGKADATGVELEAKWRFAPGWSWDINGNVIRSEFTNDSELYHAVTGCRSYHVMAREAA